MEKNCKHTRRSTPRRTRRPRCAGYAVTFEETLTGQPDGPDEITVDRRRHVIHVRLPGQRAPEVRDLIRSYVEGFARAVEMARAA